MKVINQLLFESLTESFIGTTFQNILRNFFSSVRNFFNTALNTISSPENPEFSIIFSNVSYQE